MIGADEGGFWATWSATRIRQGREERWSLTKKALPPKSARWVWMAHDIKVLNTSMHSSSQGLTQKKCKITLVRNPFWPFLKKSSWKAPVSTANFWKTKQKWQRAGKKPSSSRPGVEMVSKQLSDWIFVQKRPRNKLLSVWHDQMTPTVASFENLLRILSFPN